MADRFVIELSGRIDTSNAADTEKRLEKLLAENSGAEPVFDIAELQYISSAGLRVLMKIRKRWKNRLEIRNASPEVYEIFETTGFDELFDISKKMREVSVEGCEIIGRGFYGTVYRIDPETIVKVYESPDSINIIRTEKELARTALIAGVPTAISYDIVKVGNSYGSVFELLNAKTFNDLLIEDPANADEIIKQYAGFLRLVNEQTVPRGKLRSARELYMGYLEEASRYLDDDLTARLREMFLEIPEQLNVIHGDAQMKNIMVRDGEPMLIDMETLCAGHPIFDLQSVYVTYFAFGEDDPNNSMDFLGIPNELSERVWEKFVGYYFKTDDEERIASLRDKIAVVGAVRFLYLIGFASDTSGALFEARIGHNRKRLRELADRTDSLLF